MSDYERQLKIYHKTKDAYLRKHPDENFEENLWFARLYWRDEAERWRSRAVVLCACCLLLVWVIS